MSKRPRTTLFVNPIAGGGKCHKKYRAVARTLRDAGVQCNVITSQYRGDITRISGELAARGLETAVACGGDGTINELINGIAGTSTALGIVPLGTANDFALNMGTSKDIKLACEVIRQRQTKRIDLVRVNGDRFFAGAACLGFDAEVAAFASRRRKDRSNAFVLHLLGGILKFVSYKPKTVELRFNGTRYFGEILLVAFGNIRSYGRGILITPGAEPDDSSLEICVVRPMPRWKFLYVLPSAYKGTHVNSKEVAVYQTESVHVQSLGRTELYADGDFMTTTPFRLEVMPKHLNVIVPHSPA